MAVKTYVVLADIHYPKINKPTLDAVIDFLGQNDVDGLVFQGDQLDFESISHHTKGKPLYRVRAGYMKDINGFRDNVLDPIEELLPEGADRHWIIGNHERFEHDLIEEQPELEHLVDHVRLLDLEAKGYKITQLGHAIKIGKLNIVHGEVLSGVGNQGGIYPARKAVELYGGNVLAAHSHAPQMFTKISPVDHVQKHQGYVNAILGDTNPSYLRNRPTAWAHGMTIVELHEDGTYNLYIVNIHKGSFSYGGKMYGKKKA